jgi:hypothetical protein
MIFIKCSKDETVQVADKFRIDVSSTFVSGDPITDILIKPEATESFISVFDSNQERWYLDWAYSTDGTKTIEVQATDGTITETKTFGIESITESDDNLYSNDAQLFQIESELKRYLPQGRNSFIYAHRISQERMLSYLDRKRIYNENGDPLTKDQINLKDDVVKWSLYETCIVIYEDLAVSVGDKFKDKVAYYEKLRNYERERAQLRIDKDSSGTIDSGEIQDMKSFRMIRR